MLDGEHGGDDAVLLLTRLAVEHDTDVYGLSVDWGSAELLVSRTGGVVRFSPRFGGRISSTPLSGARRCGWSSRGTEK